MLKHVEYTQLDDSLRSEENRLAALSNDIQIAYEQQALRDSLSNVAEKELIELKHTEDQEKQTQRFFFMGALLLLALIFGGFIFKRFRVSQKQKVIIEEQKEKVDHAYEALSEKNQEILDSINYAKRIQTAILPPSRVFNAHLKNSFVLYKPKDIVAGDFYWMEPLASGPVLFAAADCTGHGVPGAMVSVVCNNGLNRSVREFGLTEPAEILDKTRELVIQEFEKSEEDVKDGMDIALCSLRMRNENEEEETHSHSASHSVLKYAGAHNPLWIVRKGESEIEEIKADKQPIGKFENNAPFTSHEIELFKGDTIYIFSDGYLDQFGGDKGKKLKAKGLKKLLLEIKDLPLDQQRQKLDKSFESWRGSLEQLDDVCVIGVRV